LKLGNHKNTNVEYDILNKEDEVFYKENKVTFNKMYNYFGLDLKPAGDNVMFGDICKREFKDSYKDKQGFF
jgi:hypothetical protein